MPPLFSDLRLLLVADDPLARAGLATLLANRPGFTVAGQVSSEGDLAADLDLFQPNVIIWDTGWDPAHPTGRAGQSTVRSNLERLADLGELEIPIVALLPEETVAAEVWAAGARGLLRRDAPVEDLLLAAQVVSQKLALLDPLFANTLLPGRPLETPPPAEELTPREREVLQLLAEGLPNKLIAQRLSISDHTVKFHVNAILTKLSVQSRTEAVVRATRLGLILL
ncbi:MAG: response regulator transcription factor [Chloroflexota bacterium]